MLFSFFLFDIGDGGSLHPQFTVINNFITGNVYMCIETNAHSLFALLLIMRDILHDILTSICGYWVPKTVNKPFGYFEA